LQTSAWCSSLLLQCRRTFDRAPAGIFLICSSVLLSGFKPPIPFWPIVLFNTCDFSFLHWSPSLYLLWIVILEGGGFRQRSAGCHPWPDRLSWRLPRCLGRIFPASWDASFKLKADALVCFCLISATLLPSSYTCGLNFQIFGENERRQVRGAISCNSKFQETQGCWSYSLQIQNAKPLCFINRIVATTPIC
jgi:hypothetical protein